MPQPENRSGKLRKLLRKLGHAEFLRFGVRDRILRFFHNPDLAESEEFCIDFFGMKYRGNFNCFLDWSVFYYGAYAKDELRILEDLINKARGSTILDIGANVGHHSLFFSKFGKKVHSFEPFSEVSARLEQKIADNGLKNVHLHKIALGEKDEVKEFFASDSNNTGTGSFVNRQTSREPVKLSIFNGDSYLERNNITDIGFIKIDVEGFEIEVLKGLKQTINKYQPIIFFEWSCTDSNNEFKAFVQSTFPENVYQFSILKPAQPFLVFLSDQKPGLVKLSHIKSGNLTALPSEAISHKN